MIQITKKEAQAVRSRFPAAHIYRTARQKSKRHHYWCAEEPGILAMIAHMRGEA